PGAGQRSGAQPGGAMAGVRRHPASVAVAGGAHRRRALGSGGVYAPRGAQPGRAGRAARSRRGAALAVPVAADVGPAMTVEEAGSRVWDVLVVGAGPAGTMAARELAQRGAAVLLVDRAAFPRWKVCGCCLNHRALSTLEAAGLGEMVRRCGAVPLDDVQI